ncbi:MAG: efflux RND transporter permease subunit [Sporomusaceae bacterium]|nr:efflux RND transporter permease subunit [Sporomusaceae bacterium]
MKNFNLTEWALNHKHFIYFFIALFFIAGFVSYKNLGRMEDPDFTIKQMVVTVAWPGATARQIEDQVTDKVEKKLQDLPGLDYLQSYSAPGYSVIYVNVKDTVPKAEIRGKWLEARNMVNDIVSTLPEGVMAPQFNDRFDEVYGVVYALTGDGYTYEEMREKAEKVRRILMDVPSVKKVNLLGVQTEKIYIEIENDKMAQLGITPSLVTSTLQAQNAMNASGMLETASDNLYLRITGMFENLDDIRNTPLQANGKTIRLGDIAKISRAYAEPTDPKFYYNGTPAIGISLAMEPGGNILVLGETLEKTVERIKKELPAGLEIHQTVNQPKVVETSIDEFVESLAEAIIIVLAVSFASLGMRSGIIVALCIPLVIAVVFTCMNLFGIDLQRISLGALIIALGLLVDDAIITIETMVVKLEQGWSRFNAACFAYSSTAYPRLTGELVTCAGFIPVGFAKGSASEYCMTIFTVVAIALMASWLVAGTVTPLLGYLFIRVKPHSAANAANEHDIYDTKLYRAFKRVLIWCLYHRKTVLVATVAVFFVAVGALGFVRQEFFPSSTRPELILQLKLQEGASLKNTEDVASQVAKSLEGESDISYYTYHVGEGAPRFVLSFDPTFNKPNFSEFVIVAKDAKSRDALRVKLEKNLAQQFPSVRVHTKVIANGPSADYPVMLRVKGYDVDKVREIAQQMEQIMAQNPNVKNTNLNWVEKSKIVHLTIDQDKARALGVTTQSLANSLQAQLSGAPITEFREKDKTVSMVFRFDGQDRNDPERLKNTTVYIGNGKYVPLEQIAKISFDAEEGLIYRRDLKPMIIVQAETRPGATGDDVAEQIYKDLADLRANLPLGYEIEYDGSKESSIKAAKFLSEPVPMMIIAIMIFLMIQLQNIPKMILTLLTAPLGIIGVAFGLLLTNSPMGFVVQLGILALSGIIMRNTIILMDQIDQLLAAGESLWDAIINATVIRFRPILLTAAAAILGMIPLVSSIFWGPMAVAIAGGLLGATVLTLLVLPVLYATWYKVELPSTGKATGTDNSTLNA